MLSPDCHCWTRSEKVWRRAGTFKLLNAADMFRDIVDGRSEGRKALELCTEWRPTRRLEMFQGREEYE
jgi:hypothetical protein